MRSVARRDRQTAASRQVMAAILVIDDEAPMRRTIRRIAETAGHTILEAENGREGVRLFQDHRPALVITDIMMPEKEGIETIREIRAVEAATKILAVSGGGARGELAYL